MTDTTEPEVTSAALGRERIEVSSGLDGERIDRALAMITGLSRSEVAAIISAGHVGINGKTATVRHLRVVTGDVVDFVLEPTSSADVPLAARGDDIAFEVAYEDDAIIVVDKPAGLVVHPGAGHRDDTLVSGLISRYPDLVAAARAGAGEPMRPGIVHRLDKDTSGLLVVARTADAYRSLVGQLASRAMGREYEALALGTLENDAGTIEAPIGRSTRDPTKMTVHASGRAARTSYSVISRFDAPVALTLVHLRLETGRTHQIRVHLSAIGHPVAGDARYGGRARELVLDRPFLHAARLSIIHPVTGAAMSWASPLPGDLARCLEDLQGAEC